MMNAGFQPKENWKQEENGDIFRDKNLFHPENSNRSSSSGLCGKVFNLDDVIKLNSDRIPDQFPSYWGKGKKKKKKKEAKSSGGVQREFVGTTGFGLSLEIALPKFIVGRVTSYTGVGIDAGFFRDKNGFGLYATTKSTKNSGVAFSAQIEGFMTLNYASDPRTTNIDRAYIKGPGYETGLGLGSVGGSYGTNTAANYGRISPYQMISISWGAGIDVGFVHWNTHTYVTDY